MKQDDIPSQPSSRKRWSVREFGRILPLALIIVFSLAVTLGGAGKVFRLETILTYHTLLHDFVDSHELLSVLAFVGLYVAAIALSLPAALFFSISGGFLFGWLPGGLMAVFSKTLGSLLLFLLARYSFSAFAGRKLGGRLSGIGDSFRDDSFFYMLFLRLQPVIPFWVVNLGAALFDVPLRRFVLATIIGIAPAAFIFATAGAGVDGVIAVEKRAFEQCLLSGATDCTLALEISDLLTPTIMVVIVTLALLSLVPVAMKRWSKGRTAVSRP